MKKRLLTVLLAVCLVLALGTVTALADDAVVTDVEQLESAIANAQDGDTITLGANITATETIRIPSDKSIVLDLHGFNITNNVNNSSASAALNVIVVEGELTILDSTAEEAPTVNSDYSVADYSAGGIYGADYYGTTVVAANGGSVVIENGIISATGNLGVSAVGNVQAGGEAQNSTVTINGGYVIAQEYAATAQGNGAELTVNGGVIVAKNNAAIGGNGTKNNQVDRGGTVISINGGTVISHITSDGYIACGVYHPQQGQLNITGGTIVADGGVGVLMRGGDANITGGTIIATGDENTSGGVGDANNDVGAYGVVYDLRPTYPGHEEGDVVHISGDANVEAAVGAVDVIEESTTDEERYDEIVITGGTFSSDIGNYIQAGAALTQDENGTIVVDESAKTVANVDGVGYTELAKAIAAADSGDTVTLLEDVKIGTSLELKDGITLDLGGNTLTSTDDYTVVCATGASAEVINGNLTGGTNSTVYNNGTALTLNGVNVTYSGSRCAIQNNTGSLTLVDCTVNGGSGGGIWDFGTKSSVALTSSTVTGGYFAVYHNGTTAGFTLTAENSTIIGDSDVACAIYVSGSTTSTDRDGINSINLTGCTVTGPTGIEGKYTNMVLTDCDITATAEPDFEQNNNGTTALGFAVVSTDNSMDPNSPAPESDITINGGAYDGIVGLGQYENIDEYEGFQESDYTVTGGSFANPLPTEYLDDGLNAELYSRSNSDTPYSYYSTVEKAMDAAQPGDIVTDLSEVTSDTRYDVTFNYGNNDSETVSVSEGATITFTAPTRSGYEFRGWRDGSGELYKAGESVTVDSDMVFTAVWSAINIPDTYDIEIADTANGEVDTSLSNASAGSTITITATPDSGYSVASVTVTGPDGRVDVTRVNATTYTFKMPAGDVTVRVTFSDSDALPFTDVSAGQWFYDAVAYVYTNGMMEGDSATTFNPDGTMTRAMFWAVLGRIDGATITGTNWTDQARDWAMAEGVSDGTDPNGLVTREQMVTMLWRYAVAKGYDVTIGESTNILSYADFGQISEYAIPAMQWGCGSGVITGMTDTTLVPQGTATRAQCAAIFMRFDQM